MTRHGALRVPEVTLYFWVIKLLSTAMGEATSDYSVHAIDPVIAVILGFCGFVIALALQFSVRRYIAWTYWLAVCGVGVFGTMAADVLHVRFGVPYAASTALYAVLLAAVFLTWDRVEHTLSFHTIDTMRREMFYWAAVVATFAMGTALGDLSAYTAGLGYFPSALVFAAVISIPAIGYWKLALESDPRLLVRLCRHPAPRGLDRRLAQQGEEHERARLGGRSRRARLCARHLRLRCLSRRDPSRRTTRRGGRAGGLSH